MGGQGDGNERDSWSDGGDNAELEEREKEMQNRSLEPGQHIKKKVEDENSKAETWRNKGSWRADADREEDDKVFT